LGAQWCAAVFLFGSKTHADAEHAPVEQRSIHLTEQQPLLAQEWVQFKEWVTALVMLLCWTRNPSGLSPNSLGRRHSTRATRVPSQSEGLFF